MSVSFCLPEREVSTRSLPTHSVPTRLHHTAYVTRDLEATRRFYEDLIGLPMIATSETAELFGAERALARRRSHAQQYRARLSGARVSVQRRLQPPSPRGCDSARASGCDE